MTRLLKAAGLALLAGSIALTGCSGSDGKDGAPGANGAPGADGASGAPGADGQDGVGLASPAIPSLVVNDVVFGVDATNHVTARFSVTDGSAWVTGLTTTSTTLYLAGLIPGTNGSSDEWQAWSSVTAATVTEGPAGTYLLVSNKLAADAPATSTTQRGVVRLARAGFNTVVKGYDFAIAAPATPVARAKDVVNDASCKECHGFGVTIHSYGRNDTRVCVICHSPKYNGTIAAHEADMVTMIHQIHTNKAATLGALHTAGHGENWPTLKYPGTMLACTKCHNTVAQADNWKTKPTRVACDSCHTTIDFNGGDYIGILGVAGTHHTATDDAGCASCHGSGGMAAIDERHKPAANDDASLRTMEAVISGATIDANGLVTVAFTVTDAGAPVTSPTAFSGLSFTLAKLVPARGDAPSYWQSYLSQARTKVASKLPVVQGRTEAYPGDGGTLTQVGSTNVYIYAFALKNASTPGDIRTIDHVHNSSTVPGDFNKANLTELRFVVPYEPTRTHRIAMSFNKELGANDIANKWNAHLDFVPAGGSAETRNIVSRTACNGCHGDSKLHAGFDLEYCVGCHNQNSFDPFSGADPTGAVTVTDTVSFGASSVALERIVHKIHMGKGLANGFVLNGTHDYSGLQYPGGVPSNSATPSPRDCTVCHVESSPGMTDAARWKTGNRACGSCHDDIVASAHIAANTFDPTPSTSPLGAFSGDEVEACSICHAPGGLAPVDAAHLGAVR